MSFSFRFCIAFHEVRKQMQELGILCCATALFLLAINLMGSGVHKAAGERLERLMERLTHGR